MPDGGGIGHRPRARACSLTELQPHTSSYTRIQDPLRAWPSGSAVISEVCGEDVWRVAIPIQRPLAPHPPINRLPLQPPMGLIVLPTLPPNPLPLSTYPEFWAVAKEDREGFCPPTRPAIPEPSYSWPPPIIFPSAWSLGHGIEKPCMMHTTPYVT